MLECSNLLLFSAFNISFLKENRLKILIPSWEEILRRSEVYD